MASQHTRQPVKARKLFFLKKTPPGCHDSAVPELTARCHPLFLITVIPDPIDPTPFPALQKNVNTVVLKKKRSMINGLLYVINTYYRSDPRWRHSMNDRKTTGVFQSAAALHSFSYQSFGLILRSKTRTDPSPRPAAMSERCESHDRLVTQLSAPVGMSWWS